MKHRLVSIVIATVMAAVTWQGASANASVPTTPVRAGSYAQFAAIIAAQPVPTTAQMEAAQAILKAHPLSGSVTLIPMLGRGGAVPMVWTAFNWWGVRLHLSQADVHTIWNMIWAGGMAAAVGSLCTPGGPLAVACGVFGAVVGWLVSEIIWQYVGPWVPSCGMHIDINWNLSWHYGWC